MEFRARVVILLSLIQFSKAGFSCSGMGRRWCDLEAVDEDECPKTCQKKVMIAKSSLQCYISWHCVCIDHRIAVVKVFPRDDAVIEYCRREIRHHSRC